MPSLRAESPNWLPRHRARFDPGSRVSIGEACDAAVVVGRFRCRQFVMTSVISRTPAAFDDYRKSRAADEIQETIRWPVNSAGRRRRSSTIRSASSSPVGAPAPVAR